MPRRWALSSFVAAAIGALAVGACNHEPKYDDEPIARDDRKKKSPEPPETFDLDALCKQLVDLVGTAIDPAEQPDLLLMCRNGLAAVRKDRPDEYACRCRCIRDAGDLTHVEKCERYCIAEDASRVCDHVVGVENDTNDAGVLDDAHKSCVRALEELHDEDRSRWFCTVRCLVTSTAKLDALACNAKCGGTLSDAGVDADETGPGSIPTAPPATTAYPIPEIE